MGVQTPVLLVIVLLSFSSPASFALVSKNLVSENAHENKGDNEIDDNISTIGGGSRMVNQSKYTAAVRGGGGGGGGGGHSGAGDSQSNSSPQNGNGGNRGNGVVPVFAAGAAGQRRNHKGASATCSPYWKGVFAILIASTSLLLDIRM